MISDIKNKANSIFLDMGYPTIKDEDWKYTNTKKISQSRTTFEQANLESISEFQLDNAINITLVNGKKISNDNIQESGLRILDYQDLDSMKSLGEFLTISNYNNNGVIAHNTSEFNDVVYLTIDKNFNSDIPINITSIAYKLNNNEIIFPRIYIHLKKNSKAKIFIQNISKYSKGATNCVTEFFCEDSSKVEIIHISNINKQNFIDSIFFKQQNCSKIKFLSTAFGGELYRANIEININGNNCENKFGVLMLGAKNDHIDYHTNINHKSSHSYNNFACRSMLKDNSNGVFNGKILVGEKAFDTNSILNNDNLLLSDKSQMQSNPQLEINCEDVKCSHGSTSGDLDKNALFYLQSRGINLVNAKEILTEGFVNKLLSSFDSESLLIGEKVKQWIQN